MDEGRMPESVNLTKTIVELVPRIQNLTSLLLSLCKLNRTVHNQTYNDLISSLACKRVQDAKDEAKRHAEAERKAKVEAEVKQKKARIEQEKAQATTLSAALEAMQKIQAKDTKANKRPKK